MGSTEPSLLDPIRHSEASRRTEETHASTNRVKRWFHPPPVSGLYMFVLLRDQQQMGDGWGTTKYNKWKILNENNPTQSITGRDISMYLSRSLAKHYCLHSIASMVWWGPAGLWFYSLRCGDGVGLFNDSHNALHSKELLPINVDLFSTKLPQACILSHLLCEILVSGSASSSSQHDTHMERTRTASKPWDNKNNKKFCIGIPSITVPLHVRNYFVWIGTCK